MVTSTVRLPTMLLLLGVIYTVIWVTKAPLNAGWKTLT
jgi:hypothetical protein